MPIIQVQKVAKSQSDSINVDDTLARFCYYFPQYRFVDAKKMPYKRIIQMLNVAIKEQAREHLTLTRIICSPHTKNGSEASKLVEEFKRIIEG